MDVDTAATECAVSAAEPVVMETSVEEPKKIRKRQKKLCSDICRQMEFYFSDANLNKDRFLKKHINKSEDGYIDISVFSKFNKIRQLTEDMNLVSKALGTSNMLEVTQDGKRVRRSTPIAEPKDVDDRTIYVECLPLTADHSWVRTVFEACGKVLYVSLPKYQSTGDLKGFGFVEFDCQESALRACQMLNNPPANAADKLGWFPRGSKDFRRLERQVRTQKPEALENCRDPRLAKRGRRQRTVSESAVSEDSKKQHKRPRTTSECSDGSLQTSTDQPESAKRLKLNIEVSEKSLLKDGEENREETEKDSKDNDGTNIRESSTKKRSHEKRDIDNSDTSDSETEPSASTVKKVRISEDAAQECSQTSQTKKKSNRKRKKKTIKEESKKDAPELRVMAKQEWLDLRKEYLQLQKSSMKKLKQALKTHSNQPGPHRTPLSHTDNKQPNGSSQETTQVQSSAKPAAQTQIEFTPNVIIKVTSETDLTRKAVKDHASKLAEVAYVDIKEGSTEGFIRCHQAEHAAKIAATESEQYKYIIIQGEEEQQYWAKLQSDRDHKLNSKTRDKKRGRDKMFKRSDKALKDSLKQKSKHVVFEDD